jgi:hypothetical protein
MSIIVCFVAKAKPLSALPHEGQLQFNVQTELILGVPLLWW